MEFGTKDLLYILGIIIAGIVTFYSTKHGIKEYARDKFDELKDEIHHLKVAHEKLKGKDDLQQQVIDQIGKQINELLPSLLNAVKSKNDAP